LQLSDADAFIVQPSIQRRCCVESQLRDPGFSNERDVHNDRNLYFVAIAWQLRQQFLAR